VIETIAPRLLDTGSEMLLIGENFGEDEGDVLDVEVDGISCRDIQLRPPTALVCVAPAPSKERIDAAATDVSVLSNLTVVLVTKTGVRSASQRISYTLAGAPLVDAPSEVIAWRPVGRGGTVVVRWAYPEDNILDPIAEVTSFDLELTNIASASGSGSTLVIVPANRTVLRRAVGDMVTTTTV